jgi:integrase
LFLYREILKKDIGYVNGVVRAKRPHRLPVVLTRQEIRSILGLLHGSDWLMAMLLYGAGLRLMECLRLRVKDVDFTSNQIVVRAGKGDKDRRTMLPAAVKEPLTKYLDAIKRLHQRDIERGLGRVTLPNALERKYPNAGKEWGWQWLFPATSHFTDKVTGENAGIICTNPCCKKRCESLASPNRRARIRFGIRSRLIYSKMVMTSEPSRNYLGIET